MSRSILIADDHPLFRQALRLAVGRVVPDAAILEAGSLTTAAAMAASAKQLDLILLDLKMPGATGFSSIDILRAECPEVPILVISSAGPGAAREAIGAGAVAYLDKGSDLGSIEAAIARSLDHAAPSQSAEDEEARDRIRAAVASFTPTQLRVLLAVLDGQLNKQIAHRLGISEATVKVHMTAIMRKLDVRTRTQAALVVRSLGIDLRS